MPRAALLSLLAAAALLALPLAGCTPDAEDECRSLAKVMGRVGDDVFVAQKKHNEQKDAASLGVLAGELDRGAARVDKVAITRPDLLGPRKELSEAFRAGARASADEKAARDKGDQAAAATANRARRDASAARQKATTAVSGVCRVGSSSSGP